MKKNILILMAVVFAIMSCKKTKVTSLESPKELKIIGWDSLSKYGGYVNCGNAGKVDADGISFNFVASSLEGAVTITNYTFHINTSDGSKPITMFTMWDSWSGSTKNILVAGNDVEFSGMKDVVPEGDNGRWFGVNVTYSCIGRNGVVSGKTISTVTLTSYTYRDQQGLVKTVRPNLTSRKRMSVYSYLVLQGQSAQRNYGLYTGLQKIYERSFSSHGGDHVLIEVPLKIKAVDCSLGAVPQIQVSIYDGSNTVSFSPAQTTRIDDSTVVVALPQPVLIRKDHVAVVNFFADIQSVSPTATSPSLKTYLGNLKYLKYTEVSTGTEFSTQNEQFMWTEYYYNPSNVDFSYWELYL